MRVNSGVKTFPKLQVLKASLFSLLQKHAWEGKIGKIGEGEEDKSGKGFCEGE
jgi:hypothetical protein